MQTFDHLLNWKLQIGSHTFPGPRGGTCINEAAVVAAGFEYQPVPTVESMPDCFSRPICRFALWLNDTASDRDRQRLLPFVTRLACADTPRVERKRAAYIRRRTWFYCGFVPFEQGLQVLEGALAIGRQADPIPLQDVSSRLDAARAAAPRRRKARQSTADTSPTMKASEPAG